MVKFSTVHVWKAYTKKGSEVRNTFCCVTQWQGFFRSFQCVCVHHTWTLLLSHQGNNICIHFNILCSFLMQKSYCKWHTPAAASAQQSILRNVRKKNPLHKNLFERIFVFSRTKKTSQESVKGMANLVSHKNTTTDAFRKACKKCAKGHGMCQNKPKKIMFAEKVHLVLNRD